MTDTEILIELSKLGSQKATMELASRQRSFYEGLKSVNNQTAMYCPEHEEVYAKINNPYSNSICGFCGKRKSNHYQIAI